MHSRPIHPTAVGREREQAHRRMRPVVMGLNMVKIGRNFERLVVPVELLQPAITHEPTVPRHSTTPNVCDVDHPRGYGGNIRHGKVDV